jgi:hypothetical protein
MNVVWIVGDFTALRKVPRYLTWVIWIRVVRAGLSVQAVCPHGSESNMDDGAQQGIPYMNHPHDSLDQEDEHGDDGDDNVVRGDARTCQSRSVAGLGGLTIGSISTVLEVLGDGWHRHRAAGSDPN